MAGLAAFEPSWLFATSLPPSMASSPSLGKWSSFHPLTFSDSSSIMLLQPEAYQLNRNQNTNDRPTFSDSASIMFLQPEAHMQRRANSSVSCTVSSGMCTSYCGREVE